MGGSLALKAGITTVTTLVGGGVGYKICDLIVYYRRKYEGMEIL